MPSSIWHRFALLLSQNLVSYRSSFSYFVPQRNIFIRNRYVLIIGVSHIGCCKLYMSSYIIHKQHCSIRSWRPTNICLSTLQFLLFEFTIRWKWPKYSPKSIIIRSFDLWFTRRLVNHVIVVQAKFSIVSLMIPYPN